MQLLRRSLHREPMQEDDLWEVMLPVEDFLSSILFQS